MSLRSARPVDDSLSELAEQMALDEPSTARDNGETREQVQVTHQHVFQTQPPVHTLKKRKQCHIWVYLRWM